MNIFRLVKIVGGSATLVVAWGCGSMPMREVESERVVSLEETFENIRSAFKAFRPKPGEEPIGLLPSEVSVVLALTKAATDTNQIGVDLRIAPIVRAIPSASFDRTSLTHSQAVNTVTIVFKGVYFSSLDTVIGKQLSEGDTSTPQLMIIPPGRGDKAP